MIGENPRYSRAHKREMATASGPLATLGLVIVYAPEVLALLGLSILPTSSGGPSGKVRPEEKPPP